ncbi:MAG: hypothetical protein WCN98_09995, partial [Verrucomicrobiaceae bacterium]
GFLAPDFFVAGFLATGFLVFLGAALLFCGSLDFTFALDAGFLLLAALGADLEDLFFGFEAMMCYDCSV